MSSRLSICIPTFNRSKYLKECLESIMLSAKGLEDHIEIVISDNASEDDTTAVVSEMQSHHPGIRYHRNETTIDAHMNFRLVAGMAASDYVWIFGDDDKLTSEAIPCVLKQIEAGYDLVLCNYSIWSKDFSEMKKQRQFKLAEIVSFGDPNELLSIFGTHLGYISSIIVRKSRFLTLPADKFEEYICFGFPHMYAYYYGLYPSGRSVYLPEPLLCNRSDNWGEFDWWKYFVEGSSFIFNSLLARGYSPDAVRSAKHDTIRDFVIPHVLGRKLEGRGAKGLFRTAYRYYKSVPLFWFGVVPALLAPRRCVLAAHWLVRKVRKRRGGC